MRSCCREKALPGNRSQTPPAPSATGAGRHRPAAKTSPASDRQGRRVFPEGPKWPRSPAGDRPRSGRSPPPACASARPTASARHRRCSPRPTAARAGRPAAVPAAARKLWQRSLVFIQEFDDVAELGVVGGQLLLHVVADLGIGGVAVGFQKTLEFVAFDDGL